MHVALDTSDPGVGKTFMTSIIAILLDLPLFVICPNNVQDNWRDIINTYGISNITVMSYNNIQGRGGEVIGLAQGQPYVWAKVTAAKSPRGRGRPTAGSEVENFDVALTQDFLDQVDEGILLVGDEAQEVKNESSHQHKVFAAMARAIGAKWRVGLARV